MKKFLGLFLGFLLVVGLVGISAANTIDLTGNGGVQSSYGFNDGTVNLAVTASVHQGNNWYGAFVGQYYPGLGVTTYADTSHELDGDYGWLEVLWFDFGQEVTLSSVLFAPNYVDSNDGFQFFVDGSTDGLNYFPILGNNPYTIDVTGTVFGIGAWNYNDNYKIENISYTTNPVPEPATMVLLGLGLLGLAGVSRKKP